MPILCGRWPDSDVLDQAGCRDYDESRRGGAEIVTATVEALENRSEFVFHIQDWKLGSLMTVTITKPCPGLSRAGEQRAVDNMADRVLQLVENATKIRPLRRAMEAERTRNAPRGIRRLRAWWKGKHDERA